jgi:hypothetical protein
VDGEVGGGAGLHNLAKVVTKDSRISTFSISFARRMDLRPTGHSMPRSAEREPEPGSTLTQTIMVASYSDVIRLRFATPLRRYKSVLFTSYAI